MRNLENPIRTKFSRLKERLTISAQPVEDTSLRPDSSLAQAASGYVPPLIDRPRNDLNTLSQPSRSDSKP